MENNIKQFFSTIFENINEIGKCQEMILDWSQNLTKSTEIKNQGLIYHLITKSIRYFYQFNLSVKNKLNQLQTNNLELLSIT
jgi:hypothetical protein